MRNVFDQYEQPENKLTHALACTLSNEPRLIRPFLKWLGISQFPHLRHIQIGIQQSPGDEAVSEKEGEEGLPDMCFFDDNGWAVLIECKIQAKISVSQLRRHSRTAARYGYRQPSIAVFAVDIPTRSFPDEIRSVLWKDIYSWFTNKAEDSIWCKQFAEYMELFEAKMLAQDYDIRGTLTMFDGFKFSDKNPYTYSEGKRLIRLLGEELRRDRQLTQQLGLDPKGKGRGAITRGEYGNVWDYIPLVKARNAKLFTDHPHATMGIHPMWTTAAVTIPNGVKGKMRARLKEIGHKGFENLLCGIERRLRKVLATAPSSQPMLYLVQRHYPSQRSSPVVDGRIDVDLRTVSESNEIALKHQPMWCESIYDILTHKRTNIQWGIDVRYPHNDKIMRSRKALETISKTWIAMKPLVDFATERQI